MTARRPVDDGPSPRRSGRQHAPETSGNWGEPSKERTLLSLGRDASRVRVPKVAEMIADRIRRQIIKGELRDGDALPSEQEMTVLHGASRPTVREAVRLLEGEGLAYMQRGRGGGARVSAPTGASAAVQVGLMLEYLQVPLSDLVEAHNTLELSAAAILVRRRRPGDLKALRENVREGQRCGQDADALVRVTTNFHVIMVQRAGNQALSFLHTILTYLTAETTRRMHDPNPKKWGRLSPVQGQRHHEEVVALIDAQDVAAADQVWRAHVAECRSFMLAGINANTTLDALNVRRV